MFQRLKTYSVHSRKGKIIGKKKRSVVVRGGGWREGVIKKGPWKSWGVMELFMYWLYDYIRL